MYAVKYVESLYIELVLNITFQQIKQLKKLDSLISQAEEGLAVLFIMHKQTAADYGLYSDQE